MGGELAVGQVLDPSGALGGRHREQGVEVDHGRRPRRLAGADRHRASGRLLQAEPHHRLVDRADLLDVEGTVGESLAVEHEQPLEHLEHRAVGDSGRVDPLAGLPGADVRPALEERVAARVEQDAVPGRHPRLAGPRPVVDHPEQGEQLRPGAVALVHRVRVMPGVLAQPGVQGGERVAPGERRLAGQHVAFLGVEEEHEAQQHGEQAAVDEVGVLVQRAGEQLASAQLVGRLEAAQQCVERAEHLTGEPLGHLVLERAGAGQKRRESLRAGQGEQPPLGEQHPHRGADRPPGGLCHVGDIELQPAGALPARRGDQPERPRVAQQAGRYGRLAQQPLHAGVLGRVERVAARHGVERRSVVQHPHEQLPGGRAVLWVALAHGVVGPQRGAGLGQGDDELVGDLARLTAGVSTGREGPAEHRSGEAGKVIEHRRLRRVVRTGPLAHAAAQPRLPLPVVAGQHRTGTHERGGGDDEAGRLHEAEPAEVILDAGVPAGHQLVSGHR